MVRGSLAAADWISLSRVGLAFIFVGIFRSQPGLMLIASIVVAILAQLTDHLDGFVARRCSTPAVRGWLFDSFGDRAFYIAALLAFEREYRLGEFLVWIFVLREIALYAVRIAVGDFEVRRGGFRVLALLHAGLVRFGIVVGCTLPLGILPLTISSSGVLILTVIFGAATAFGFVCLALLFIPQRGRVDMSE